MGRGARALRQPSPSPWSRMPLLLALALAITSTERVSLGMLVEGDATAERRFRWFLDTELSVDEREDWGGGNCPWRPQSSKDRMVLAECSNTTEDPNAVSRAFPIDAGCYHYWTCLAHECESRTKTDTPLMLQCGIVERGLPLPREPGWIFLDRCAAPRLQVQGNSWCDDKSCSDEIGAVRFSYAGEYCFDLQRTNRTKATEQNSLVMLLYIVMSVMLGWIGVALCQKARMWRGTSRTPPRVETTETAVVQRHRAVKESGPLPILVEDPEGHVQFGMQCLVPGGDGPGSTDIEMQSLPLTTGPDSALGSPSTVGHTPGASTSQGEV